MKNVLFVTGTRADFGKLKALMEKVGEADNLDLSIFATGMHLLKDYGATYREILKSGFSKNLFLYINQDSSAEIHMDLTLANTLTGFGHYVREFRPDLIVVHGDRIEALAGALVGALNNILVAHIEGGERSGTIDDSLRHSVSKLAHVHFVANEEAERRLTQMGENASNIHVIGSPDIDVMLSSSLPSLSEVRERYAIPWEDYAILLYHPVTTELGDIGKRAEAVVRGVEESGLNFVVIHPNNDHGADVILTQLEALDHHENRFRRLPSMRFESFLTLLREAKLIVGNSSAGIREAPVYGVPTIDIGSRQRARSASESIRRVDESASSIAKACREVAGQRYPRSLEFGDGRSADRFIEVLRSEALWNTVVQKHFVDLPF